MSYNILNKGVKFQGDTQGTIEDIVDTHSTQTINGFKTITNLTGTHVKVTNDLTASGNISASVNISASAFYGSGAELTALNATNISTGTINNARLPTNISIATITASTHVSASVFYGIGTQLTSLDASNISTGTVNNARLPANISVTAVSASTHVSASTYYGDGSNLTNVPTGFSPINFVLS